MEALMRGKYVITDAEAKENGILEDGAIFVRDGFIEEVGDFDALKKKYPEATVKGNGRQLLMPGLADGHSHGYGLSLIQRGIPMDYLENGMVDWAFLVNVDPELCAQMCALRHLRSGCTTLHHNNWGADDEPLENMEKTVKSYKTTGIRLAYSPGGRDLSRLALDEEGFFESLPPELKEFARPCMEYDREAFIEGYMEKFEHLHETYTSDLVRIIFGPSWAMGATDAFLQRVKTRADQLGKLPIHMHTLQTPVQKQYGFRKYGKSLVAHLDDLGLVDDNLVLGHAVFVTEADIELLASKGASVTHHASCNLAIRNGIAPVYYMLKAGLNVGLGIDDKGINDDEDVIMEMRLIHRLHRVPGFDLAETPALDAFDILKIGTLNTARVCGFAGETGALKPGMRADAILVDLEEAMEDPWMSPDLNIAEVFIHRAKGVHVNTVMVDGTILMEDRRFTTIDVETLHKEIAKQAAKGISQEQRSFAEAVQKLKPYYHQWYKGWENMESKPFYVMNSRI